MKTLNFYFRGERYWVNESGQIKKANTEYSDTWRFLGGTRHHWSNSVTVPLKVAFENPAALNGCLGFDIDHGTVRQWGGRYCGKLPRIWGAYVSDEK